MADITERYITVTRDAKRSLQQRDTTQRSVEEERVYSAFRKQARDAYTSLRTVGSRT